MSAMSTSQPFGHNVVPSAVGRENSPDPDDVPIVDFDESRERDPAYTGDVPVGTTDADEDARRAGGSIEPDPAYKDDVPVGTADADEDARRAGGSR
jgi:hypothetical protein